MLLLSVDTTWPLLVLALKAVLGADCGVAGDALLPAPSGVAPPAAAAALRPVRGVAGGPCCSALRLLVNPVQSLPASHFTPGVAAPLAWFSLSDWRCSDARKRLKDPAVTGCPGSALGGQQKQIARWFTVVTGRTLSHMERHAVSAETCHCRGQSA
eukprot:GHUV01027407.1.p1 GENE.GHUV01027407.1~~GHUV01027407.1.p1  ORF type:complete len:156 (-),score=23.92 GHUV01027407.1:81-548(-)